MEKVKEYLSKPEINFWVPIITSLIIVAGAWAATMARIDRLNEKQIELENRLNDHVAKAELIWDEREDQYTEIQVKLAEIQKDIIYIKQSVGGN